MADSSRDRMSGPPPLFNDADARLASWGRSVLGDVVVSFEAPRPPEGGSGVGLYLMDVIPRPSARGVRRPPLQVTLRYLLTTWGAEPAKTHESMGALAFEALKSSEFE